MNYIDSINNKIELIINNLKKKLKSLDVNNITTDLISNLSVTDCYGSRANIKSIANISINDSLTLSVKPWDANNVKNIEKGLISSGLEVTTRINNGELFVIFPAPSGERRMEFAKKAKIEGDSFKVKLKLERQKVMNDIKLDEKNKLISQDDKKKYSSEIDKAVKKVEVDIKELVESHCDKLMKI